MRHKPFGILSKLAAAPVAAIRNEPDVETVSSKYRIVVAIKEPGFGGR